VYDRRAFRQITQFRYDGEGWGLTNDGKHLIMSDGSEVITFRDPDTFAEVRKITVRAQGKPVKNLNELEYIEGEIWANIWYSDIIARIDPTTGIVKAWVDMEGLPHAKTMRRAESKILSWDALGQLATQWREAGLQVVLTNGCFDLLHVGHLRYLQAARELGDLLVVGVNSDESVRQLKSAPRPYRPEAERAELVAGLECVDYVVIFPQNTAVELVKRVQPTYYAKGGDYTERDLPESEAVVEQGGFVVILPLEAEQSTTQLVEKIKSVEC